MHLNGVNANTYISLGLLLSIIVATWIVAGAINGTKNEVTEAKVEIINRVSRTEERIGSLEKNRETWTDADMFRWAVHLQQANPPPSTLKVPEPEMHTSR